MPWHEYKVLASRINGPIEGKRWRHDITEMIGLHPGWSIADAERIVSRALDPLYVHVVLLRLRNVLGQRQGDRWRLVAEWRLGQQTRPFERYWLNTTALSQEGKIVRDK